MRITLLTGCLLLLAFGLGEVGAQDPGSRTADAEQVWKREMRRAQREAVRGLMDSQRPRDLLLAALLYPLTLTDGVEVATLDQADAETVRLLARAAQQAPDDPLIAWAQAHCPPAQIAAGCDRDGGRERLVRLDPENGYVRLLWLSDLGPSEVELLGGALLGEAAQARRFDTYLNAVGQLFLDFFDSIEWPATPQPAMTAEALAVGYVAAIATPAYEALSRICLPGRTPPQDAALRRDCVAVFERIAAWDGASMADAQIAVSHLLRLSEGGPGENRWREELRRLRWLQEQSLPIMAGPGFMAGPGAVHIRRWFRDGEVTAMRELLRENGVAADPPPDWQPPARPGP